MNARLSVFRLIFISLFVSMAFHAQAQEKNGKGFYYPTGSSNPGGYYGWLRHNSDFNGWHLAQDFQADYDKPVYAIAEGEVVLSKKDVSSYGGVGKSGGGFIVKHKTRTDRVFYSVYGHIKTDTLPVMGQTVYAGKEVARVGHYYYANGTDVTHIHHGIMPDTLPSNPWRGYTDNQHGQHYGFVNPWHDVTINGNFYEGFLDHNEPSNGTPPPSSDYWIHPTNGNDDNRGTEGSPLRTIGKALSLAAGAPVTLHLSEGTHGVPRPFRFTTKVKIVKWGGGGRARISP